MSLQHTVTATLSHRHRHRHRHNPSLKNPKLSSSLPFPNTFSLLHSSSASSSHTKNTKPTQLGFHRHLKIKCCSINHDNAVPPFPKPSEIPWKKELSNTVQLIGVVGVPVEFKHISSGKALAWTRIGVRKSAIDTTWINLTFWEELAHIAYQHIEKGQRIFVSGRLVADTVEGDDEKLQTYYKVVVQELNFVENSFLASTSNECETNMIEDKKPATYANNTTGSTQELWQAFFANPVDWWDNRKNKKNPKYPDFKHKDTGEALWIEGRYNPPWVKSQLAILDSKMESFHGYEANPLGFVTGGETTSLL